jgi:hypothetical protein
MADGFGGFDHTGHNCRHPGDRAAAAIPPSNNNPTTPATQKSCARSTLLSSITAAHQEALRNPETWPRMWS